MSTTTSRKQRLVIPNVGHPGPEFASLLIAALQRQDSVLTVFPVEGYVGTGDGSDKAATLAAINDAKSETNGGLVFFHPRRYVLADLAATLPQSATKAVPLMGCGSHATNLAFTTDRGAGAKAIAGEATGGTFFSHLSHMTVSGPGSGRVIGTSPANMDGIRWQGGQILTDLLVTGFRNGIVATGDHMRASNVKSTANYNGIRWAEGVTADDVLLDNCDLTENAFASISIASGNVATGVTMDKGHLGFGPYGVYAETCPDDEVKLNNFYLNGTSIEGIGNGAFYSEGKHGAFSGVTCEHVLPWSIDNALFGLPASSADYYVHARRVSGWNFRQSVLGGFGVAPAVAFFDVDFIDYPFIWDEGWFRSFAYARAAAKPFMRVPVNAGGVFLRDGGGIGNESGIERARAFPVEPGATIAAGDLCEWGVYNTARRNTGTCQLAGVSLNAPVAADYDQCVLVQEADYMTLNTTEATSFAATDVLIPDPAVPHKVKKQDYAAAVAAGSTIVGRPRLAGAPTGSVGNYQVVARVQMGR